VQINQAFESFQIKGYRGIENMELTELGQVNIFVGNNNSGKTSILEAISILCDPLNLFQWLNISKRRSRGNGLYLRSDEIESIKWMFPQKNDFSDEQSYQGEISLAATDNFGKPKMIAKLSEISGTTIDDDEISSELDQEYPDDYIRSGVELEVIFTPSSSQLSLLPETDQRVVFPLWGKKEFTIKEKGKPFIENTTVSPSYNYSAEQISRKYERIFSHRKDEIVEILKEFDDKVLDVRIAAKNKINIYHQDYHQDTGLVPLPLLLAHTKSAPYPQILLAKQIGLL
jgi:AAA15 family ATPase/GTPase